MSPLWRTRVLTATAAMVAIWLGAQIAQQDFTWAVIIGGPLLMFLLARLQPLPLGPLALAFAIAGYVVGNRGFAQLMLSPNFPLLPAEGVMLVAGSLLVIQSAWRHDLPLRRDMLNFVLLSWILLGFVRLLFDFRQFGMMAVRDFATVYYAAFFYIAQDLGRDLRHRHMLEQVLLGSCLLLLPVYGLFLTFPDFFLNALTFRGNPIIFYKGDLAGTFFAVGSVLTFLRFEARSRWWWLAISLVFTGAVLGTGSRASFLGLGVAGTWLAIGGRWKFLAANVVAGAAASVAIFLGAVLLEVPIDRTPLFTVYEQVVSIGDPLGQRTYRGERSFFKGDNNIFRAVWWRAVIVETVQENPYLGLGFGHDLADRFVREYYPENNEEFSARSPHNVLLTIFARLGGIGLALFLWIMTSMAGRTWRAVRAGPDRAAPWCVAWVILTSACLGVVLEGPMGAVVFWISLGLGAAGTRSKENNELHDVEGSAATLPSTAPAL